MIAWLKTKTDLIALGIFVGIVSGATIVFLLFAGTKFGIFEKAYTKTEVLLICSRNGVSEKDCKV